MPKTKTKKTRTKAKAKKKVCPRPKICEDPKTGKLTIRYSKDCAPHERERIARKAQGEGIDIDIAGSYDDD